MYSPAGADKDTDTQPKRTWRTAQVRHTYAPRRLSRTCCPSPPEKGVGASTGETALEGLWTVGEVVRRRSCGGPAAGALR